MFSSIVLKNSTAPGNVIDLGVLAEALLFYERVHIVGNTLTLRHLLERITPRLFLSLLLQRRIVFHYLTDQIGVSTSQHAKTFAHRFVRFSSPQHTREKAAAYEFKRTAPRATRIEVSRLAAIMQDLSHFEFDEEQLSLSLADTPSLTRTVASLLRELVPNYSQEEPISFRAVPQQQEFKIETNLDFVRLNECSRTSVSAEHLQLTEAHLLALIQGAHATAFYAANLESEVFVEKVERAVQARAVEGAIERYTNSSEQICRFSEIVLHDSYALRDAVNSNSVKFAEIVRLADSADRFRTWLHSSSLDGDLLAAYYREAVKESPWLTRLPKRVTRWSLFAGIGIAVDASVSPGLGVAAGLALSAVDSFLVERLLKGWRPHQFVETDLKPLIAKKKPV